MTLVSFTLVAAILYFAKAVFIPIAVALLLTFLLSPVILRLQRWRIPKAIAIVSTVTLALATVALITWMVVTQFFVLAEQLPKYEQNLYAKIQQVKGPERPGGLTRASEIIKRVQRQLEPAETTTPAGRENPEQPLPVEVKTPKPTVWQIARSTLGPLLGPAGTAGIVIILLLAMLFKREDMRDRFIKVVSGGQLNVATEAVNDAARRISRYLLMQLVVNVTYGIPIGAGLYFIGVPNAPLWGLLATLLRFIPFLGPWIAAVFPIALSFAIDPGWTKLLLTIALFVVIELISNNLVEPWLYGKGAGMSPVAVIAGAIFWTWLWGGIGLFLCTPLTLCLVVMGKYVPGLKFLNEMFGSDPVLEPPARFYQRMLAMDSEEMLRQAEEFLEHNDLVSFYDQVMIPALILSEEDRETGQLAEIRQQFIVENSRELIDELGERECAKRGNLPLLPTSPEILCVPAKDDADEIVASMLAQLLHLEGAAAQLMPATLSSGDCEELVRGGNTRTIVISALPPAALSSARRLCRKLKRTCPSSRVTIGIWTPHSAVTELAQRMANARPDNVVTTLRSAIKQLCGEGNATTGADDLRAARSNDRTSEVPELASEQPEDLFDVTRRAAARLFDVPLAFVSIFQIDPEFWKVHGLKSRTEEELNTILHASALRLRIANTEKTVVVEDVSKEKALAEDPVLRERGIQSCVAMPLRTESGHMVGNLCVLDTRPRSFRAVDLGKLAALANSLIKAAEDRPVAAA